MIKTMTATIKRIHKTRPQLVNKKMKELKQHLASETHALTTDLYNDIISISDYLKRVEALYDNLKDTQ